MNRLVIKIDFNKRVREENVHISKPQFVTILHPPFHSSLHSACSHLSGSHSFNTN